MDKDNVVDVHHLYKSFQGKKAVVDLSLQIKRGEIFGFLGPNGSGKTTTIRMLCGLLTPDSGTGTCLGYDIKEHSPTIKRLVGYVPQAFCLYKDLTVWENLEFIASVYSLDHYKQRVVETMQELELTPYENILAGGLSGGWKQRLSLAAAIIHDPQLLLLDEPTAGVDPKARREFWNYITQLSARGMTSLVSTHYMDEAERCNRLSYMSQGRLLIEGTVGEIIAKVGISTWATTGRELAKLAGEIQQKPGIEQVVMLGNELRIAGADEQNLLETLKDFPNYEFKKVPTNLEEVFIHLVEKEGNHKGIAHA